MKGVHIRQQHAPRPQAGPRGRRGRQLKLLACVILSAVAPARAQFSPPPSPPPPPPSPPPPYPPPPSPPPATGFKPNVRIIDADRYPTKVTTSNCCQWYKWCDNADVKYQCPSALLDSCDKQQPTAWNKECKACKMCYDSRGHAADIKAKSRFDLYNPYQACIDTVRTVDTTQQVADPDWMRTTKQTQVARKYLAPGQPEFVVCRTLNYKCLKMKNRFGQCQVIPGVKVPNKFTSLWGRMFDSSTKDPRRGPMTGRLHEGHGSYIYAPWYKRPTENVANLHNRKASVTGYEYPKGTTRH